MTGNKKVFYVVKVNDMYFVDVYEDLEIKGLGLKFSHKLYHAFLFKGKDKAYEIAEKCKGKVANIIETERTNK